jgi:membrane protease YdiL (CAAX protease family)
LTLWLGVIAEDLVFRGYLVLGLGARTGSYFPWMVLSIILSIAAHLYQGVSWKLMLGQGLFALIFTGVSLITNNDTAIIPHLVYTIWLLRVG